MLPLPLMRTGKLPLWAWVTLTVNAGLTAAAAGALLVAQNQSHNTPRNQRMVRPSQHRRRKQNA
jgi:hypothetical protein